MSKKQVSMNGNGVEDGPVEGTDYIITSKGKRIDFIAVSETLLRKTQTSGTLPDVPYRENKLDFGDAVEREELTADNLLTDEEKTQWQEYVTVRDAVAEKRNADFIKAVLTKGTVFDESGIEEWKEEQVEDWGFILPDKKLELRMEYIQMELAPSPEDMMGIITGVLGKSGLPEKELESMRTMFRSALRPDTAVETEG